MSCEELLPYNYRQAPRRRISSVSVKPRTEELLYFMLWSADRLMRPTFRNLTDSYEV
jgi:hypothetical protein